MIFFVYNIMNWVYNAAYKKIKNMELKIKDIVELLNIDEKTLYRWIHEHKIPAYKINHQYHFNKTEIKEWILKNKIQVSNKVLDLIESATPVSLTQLLERGGIFTNIEGNTPIEVIKNAVQAMQLPAEVNPESLVFSLIEREELMPTAIGKGIAIPHPRNPIIADIHNECATLCLLRRPIDYHALDNEPVHAVFIILSANSKRHLQILARISFLCQDGSFSDFLRQSPSTSAVLSWIAGRESLWERK